MNNVEHLIEDWKLGAMVAGRIRKSYPSGVVPPYELVRGYHPNHSFRKSINLAVMPVSDFIAKFGVNAYRSIPRESLVRNGHRKAVSRRYVMNMPRSEDAS